MKNVFFTAQEIHRRFDLKGSTFNRFTSDEFIIIFIFIKFIIIAFLETNQLQEKMLTRLKRILNCNYLMKILYYLNSKLRRIVNFLRKISCLIIVFWSEFMILHKCHSLKIVHYFKAIEIK